MTHTAELDLAAKRLVFGKYLNCGQTCVAPDYVLADESIKDALSARSPKMRSARMYGENALENRALREDRSTRSISTACCGLIDPDKVVIGGGSDPDDAENRSPRCWTM